VYPLQVIAREDGKLDVRRRDALRSCAARLALQLCLLSNVRTAHLPRYHSSAFPKAQASSTAWGNVLVAPFRAAASYTRKEFPSRAQAVFPAASIAMRR